LLRQIKLIHPQDNLASCRIAEKSSYTFHAVSPARPPLWFQDGHIHVQQVE
jgi:hypothetical protein